MIKASHSNGWCKFVVALWVAVTVLAPGASATVVTGQIGSFDLTFYGSGDSNPDDSNNFEGSKDWTAQEIGDVETVVQMYVDQLAPNTAVRQIELDLLWYSFTGDTLGVSSNPIIGSSGSAFTGVEALWREGLDFTNTNSNSNPGGYDAMIRFDSSTSGFSWHTGSTDASSGEADFRSVVAHEMGHALGFASTYVPDTFWSGGITNYDRFLEDSSGNSPEAGTTGTPSNFNQLDNPVYFTGSAAVAAYGGNVPIYAPTTYASGSSLSHLDESTFGDVLMTPQYLIGTTVRNPGEVEWAMLEDMGWGIVVPEPTSLVLLAAGMCLALRRRRTG